MPNSKTCMFFSEEDQQWEIWDVDDNDNKLEFIGFSTKDLGDSGLQMLEADYRDFHIDMSRSVPFMQRNYLITVH